MARKWTVGELAHQASVSVRTLHHYDQVGLLTPTRSAAGHRRYTEPDVARLTQVVVLRSVGLSLGEIRGCLDSGEALAATLTRQLRDLDLRVAQTTALRDRLGFIHPQAPAAVASLLVRQSSCRLSMMIAMTAPMTSAIHARVWLKKTWSDV